MASIVARSLGIQLARIRTRKLTRSVDSFSCFFTKAARVLIVMPLSGEEQASPERILLLLKERFSDRNITLVSGTQEIYLTHLLPKSEIIRLKSDAINAFALPRAPIRQRLLGKRFDVAIDLNLDFVLPSGYICTESGARFRVGFDRKHAEMFFNCLIRPSAQASITSLYDRLATCLEMF
jgi:hypothetical protein